MMAILGAIVNVVVTAVSLPVLGVPIYVYILLNLVVGTVIAMLVRGE